MSMESLSQCAVTHPPPEIAGTPEKRLKSEPETPLKSDSSVSQPVVTKPPPKSAEASGKRLNLKSVPLSERLYNMEESEIRELYDNREKPFYYMRNGFEYRNKAQIRLDEEIKKAMDEYNERRRNLSAYDAIAPPAIAHLLGSIRPLEITDDNRPILSLCNLALDQYNTQNQGEVFVFDDLVKSTGRLVAGYIYYITFQAKSGGDAIKTFQAKVWRRMSSEGPPVVMSCFLKPT